MDELRGQPAGANGTDQSIFLGTVPDGMWASDLGLVLDGTTGHFPIRTVRRHEAVFAQGARQECLFVILSGGVRSYFVSPQGREFTLAFWAPGHLVGAPLDFDGRRHGWSGEAIVDTRLAVLPVAEIERLMCTNNAFALQFLKLLSRKSTCYSSLLQFIATSTVRERLEMVIAILVAAYGAKRDGEIFLGVPVTQAELARFTGCTRQAVQKHLQALATSGRLRIHKGRIYLPDPGRRPGPLERREDRMPCQSPSPVGTC